MLVIAILVVFLSGCTKTQIAPEDLPINQDEIDAELITEIDPEVSVEEAKNIAGQAYLVRSSTIRWLNCSDTDGGINFTKTGQVTAVFIRDGQISTQTWYDRCKGSNLTEHYCRDKRHSRTITTCDYGCSNGACVPSPTTGTLSISSVPSQATIYIDNDNKNYGYTPKNIELPAGKHFVILTKLDYNPTPRNYFDINLGKVTELKITLSPINQTPKNLTNQTNETFK